MALPISSRFAVVAASAALAPTALAVGSMTLTSGDVSWSLNGLEGARLTDLGGKGDFKIGSYVSPFQHWMWYRTEHDSREFALSNQTFSDIGTDHAALHYTEDAGGFNDALLFVTEYTVADLGGGIGEATVNFGVFNLLGAGIAFNLYSYTDADMGGTATDESAIVSGPLNEVQSVVDATTGSTLTYTASTRRLEGYEIAAFGDILPRLTDTDDDALANVGSPFGPGDYTGAYQWNASVTNLSVAFVGSVKYRWEVVPEPSLMLMGGLAGVAILKRRKR